MIENSDLIKISKKLVTLKDDINLPIPIEELNFIPLEANKLINFLEKMEFNKIKLNVESKFGKKKKPFHHMRNLINLTQSWCKKSLKLKLINTN